MFALFVRAEKCLFLYCSVVDEMMEKIWCAIIIALLFIQQRKDSLQVYIWVSIEGCCRIHEELLQKWYAPLYWEFFAVSCREFPTIFCLIIFVWSPYDSHLRCSYNVFLYVFPYDFFAISLWFSYDFKMVFVPSWFNYFLHIVVDFPGIFVFPCDYDLFYRVECQQRNEFDWNLGKKWETIRKS